MRADKTFIRLRVNGFFSAKERSTMHFKLHLPRHDAHLKIERTRESWKRQNIFSQGVNIKCIIIARESQLMCIGAIDEVETSRKT